jgi:four helix bundle protein
MSEGRGQLPIPNAQRPILALACGVHGYGEEKSLSLTKPYDLRDRLFEYACAIVRLVEDLQEKGAPARSLADQVLRAGNSAGANYEEADDGSSTADTRAKRRLTLRELKEALFRLRVLRATRYLTDEHDPVIKETLELKRIVATLVNKSAKRNPPR